MACLLIVASTERGDWCRAKVARVDDGENEIEGDVNEADDDDGKRKRER
jgi:hypothetical protein